MVPFKAVVPSSAVGFGKEAGEGKAVATSWKHQRADTGRVCVWNLLMDSNFGFHD